MFSNPKTVVFVCTGNYYRSRFAEYLFNALAKKNGLFWRATSRGLKTWIIRPQEGAMSEFAAYRLTGLEVPFDAKRFPIQLAELDLADADLVVAVKKTEHYPMMQIQFPKWADRITYWHVNDLDCATADEALPVCEACVESLVTKLLAEQQKAATKRAA